MASVTFAETLPWIAVSLPSGVLIDRHDRRWIMQLAAAGRVLLMVLLIAALLFHLVSIGLLIGLGFLLGCADVFGSNSANGLVRNLVASTQMERANGVVGTIDFVGGSFIGPALGNVLFAIVAFLPFGADAAAVLIAIALLASVPGNFRAAPTNSVDAGMWREIVVGVAWLWRHRALRILALLAEASNLGFGMVQGILVLFVLEIMHLPRAAYGPLLAALAVGGLLGAVLGGRFGSRWRSPKVLLVILAAQAVAAAGAAPDVPVVATALAVAGLAAGIWDVVSISFRQLVVPDQLLGRVTSGYRLVGIGATPIGALLGGGLASAFGLRLPFYAAAAVLGVAAVAAVTFLRQQDLKVTASQGDRQRPRRHRCPRQPAQEPARVTWSPGACGRPGRGCKSPR